MGRFVYVNGCVVDAAEASVSVGDRGLLYGDGLFETLRVCKGRIVRWERHLMRLFQGARVIFLDSLAAGFDPEPVVREICEANGLADARVRLTVTRGPVASAGRIGVSGGDAPTVIVTADPLPSIDPAPARMMTSSMRRDEQSPLSRVKSLNYLPGILARTEAERNGADDALLLNTRGSVAEAATSNLFLVRNNALVTPSIDQGVLPGTVRDALLELGPGLGYRVEEREVRPEELFEAGELFLTNAIGLIRPVMEVDGRPIGTGSFDTSTRLLNALKESEE